jgi:hypothetical protein
MLVCLLVCSFMSALFPSTLFLFNQKLRIADFDFICLGFFVCVLQGIIAKKMFADFRIVNFESLAMGRGYFEKKNVPQYFEMAKSYKSLADEC